MTSEHWTRKYIDNVLRHSTQEEITAVVAALRKLPYAEYLKTFHWTVVRCYVLEERGSICEKCRKKRPVDVHHKTYEHRGEEYNYLGDLQLLCRKCHEEVHSEWGVNEQYARWYADGLAYHQNESVIR